MVLQKERHLVKRSALLMVHWTGLKLDLKMDLQKDQSLGYQKVRH